MISSIKYYLVTKSLRVAFFSRLKVDETNILFQKILEHLDHARKIWYSLWKYQLGIPVNSFSSLILLLSRFPFVYDVLKVAFTLGFCLYKEDNFSTFGHFLLRQVNGSLYFRSLQHSFEEIGIETFVVGGRVFHLIKSNLDLICQHFPCCGTRYFRESRYGHSLWNKRTPFGEHAILD